MRREFPAAIYRAERNAAHSAMSAKAASSAMIAVIAPGIGLGTLIDSKNMPTPVTAKTVKRGVWQFCQFLG
jgi:hypothetical protein